MEKQESWEDSPQRDGEGHGAQGQKDGLRLCTGWRAGREWEEPRNKALVTKAPAGAGRTRTENLCTRGSILGALTAAMPFLVGSQPQRIKPCWPPGLLRTEKTADP